MWTFILRRVLSLPLILLGISVITFILMHLIPGDPVRLFLGSEGAVQPEAIEALRRQWGLDKPLPIQYVRYIINLLHGDFGRSIHTGQPVFHDLINRFPATVELTIMSFLFVLILSVPLGVISAAKKDSWIDHISRLASLLFLSMPSFWFGLMIIYVFFFMLGIIPSPAGRLGIMDTPPPHITGLYTIDSLLAGDLQTFIKSLVYLIPPALTTSLTSIGLVVRMLRSSMVEVLQLNYIQAAEAKGLPHFAILYRHAFRNALIPTITVLAVQLGSLLGGNVVIETVFNWPGIGLYFVESIQWLDYAPVMGVAILLAAVFVIANFLADIAYALIDPRIRYR